MLKEIYKNKQLEVKTTLIDNSVRDFLSRFLSSFIIIFSFYSVAHADMQSPQGMGVGVLRYISHEVFVTQNVMVFAPFRLKNGYRFWP